MTIISTSPSVTIGDVAIRQDTDGRYSLKDLHQASGGEAKNQPANWLRAQQTQDLIAELAVPQIRGTEQKQPVTIIQGGDPKKQGTYVVRELVYAYAMWISPSFHLKVIRTFDAVMTGHVAAVETLLPSEQQTLSEIVHAKVAHLAPDLQGKGLAEIWSRIHHKFRIAKYSQLQRTRLAEAILYVTQMELRSVPAAARAVSCQLQTSNRLANSLNPGTRSSSQTVSTQRARHPCPGTTAALICASMSSSHSCWLSRPPSLSGRTLSP